MQTTWSDTKTKCIWPYLALVKGLHAKKILLLQLHAMRGGWARQDKTSTYYPEYRQRIFFQHVENNYRQHKCSRVKKKKKKKWSSGLTKMIAAMHRCVPLIKLK